MKKFLSLALLVSFINISVGLPALAIKTQATNPAIINQVEVKSGTHIPIMLVAAGNSRDAIPGDKINAIVVSDVIVNEKIVFKKGANAMINVQDVKKAGFLGNAGELFLVNGEVIDANGDKHYIQYSRKLTGEEKTYPKVCLGISIFFLWPLALLGFVKGGQAKVHPNTEMSVYLMENFKFTPESI